MRRTHAVRDATLYTLAAVAIAEGFAYLLPETAQPFHRAGFLVVLGAVIASGWRGGLKGGMVAGLLGLAGIVHLFLTFGGPLGPPSIRVVVGGTIGAFGLGLAGLIGYVRDREKRATEKEHEIATALRAANRSLTDANRTLEAFTYLVSHDLKEPVRAMDATLKACLEDHGADQRMPPEARQLVEQAHGAAGRLDHLLRGLLDLSRAARMDPADLGMVHVADIIRSDDCRARFEAAVRERGATLEVDVPPTLAVVGHRAALSQVFGNLIANAVQHHVGGAQVRVSARHADRDGVEILVEDDGPGFPPRVVEAFERGDLPPSERGSGFGLAIARRAVERMGGTLWLARSADLGGASVHVTLPLDVASRPATRAVRTDADGAVPTGRRDRP